MTYIDETFTLSFMDGDSCGERTYDAFINIECSEEPEEEPRFLSKSECTYNFVWSRPEACLRQIETKCGAVPLGYDLSPLQRGLATAQSLFQSMKSKEALNAGKKVLLNLVLTKLTVNISLS